MLPAAEITTTYRTGDASGGDHGPDRLVVFSARALGSALRLTVRVPEPADEPSLAAAGLAWDEVRAEFEAVDVALSRFRDDSELTMLNRVAGSGAVVRVSRRMRIALAAVDRAGRVTGGRFDAGVLGALERIGEHGADLDRVGLDAAAIAANRTAAPEPTGRTWPVHVPPAPVDMGGIGKGLALRWAAARAGTVLPTGAGMLLEAGGDVVHGGVPPADGWRVGIEDPVAGDVDQAQPLVVLEVLAGAVATTSVSVRSWVGPDGRPVHHLVDPRTLEPARTGLVAVTVAGADPAWAEVWTKDFFLLGRERIAENARARGLAVWWVDDRGRMGMTPEARVRTAWAAEDRLG